MKVVVRIGGHERDLDVVLRHPEATLGDLLEVVTGRPPRGNLRVGDRTLSAGTPLLDAGLHEGAVVTPDPAVAAARASGLQLVVTGGLDAGLRVPLDRSATTVGGSSAADVVLPSRTLSRRHVTFLRGGNGRLRVRDEGSRTGTSLGGRPVPETGLPLTVPGPLVLAGGAALSVRDEQLSDRPRGLDLRRQVGPTGTVPFDRPPRAVPPPPLPPEPVALPSRGTRSVDVQVSVASLVGPLLLAGVPVAVTGDPRFALIGVLSPVLGVGTYLRHRRRTTRGDLATERDFEVALAGLETRLDAAAAAERARLQELCPDPAELLRRAALPTGRLWERRPTSADFLTLHAGVADLPFPAPVRGASSRRAPEVAAALARPRLLSAPVQVDLADGGVVGVVGDRAAALAVARSLLCQAAVQSGPADLTVGVFVDEGREAAWEWAKWLPHTRRGGRNGNDRWLSAVRERSDRLLRALLDSGGDTPALLVVLDSDSLVEGTGAPARTLLDAGRRAPRSGRERGQQVAGIVLAAGEDRLPAACSTVVVVDEDGDAVVRFPEERREVPGVLAAGLSVARARGCARDLARFDDPELPVVDGGLPDGVPLLPLLDLERLDADSVRRCWRAAAAEPGMAAPVGVTESGVFTLDLVRDGPHGLVEVTTGPGSSEFLPSLVAALAARHDPTRLTFVLVDVQRGAAFDVCSRLPHTVGTISDLDAQHTDRALRALEAELDHRERLFAAAGVDDHAAYVATGPAEPLPRLLLVVDEFAVLAEHVPVVLTSLVSIAAAGRTLGVHMVVAAQRPAAAVEDDLLPTGDRAGRAHVRLGHDEVVPIRTALVTCGTSEQADAAVEVRPFAFGPPPEAQQAAASGGAPTDLERLVDAVLQATAEAGTAPPRRPWLEPLVERVDLAEVGGLVDDRVLVALADDPDRQAQYPTGWDLSNGSLLLLGTPGSGTSTALAGLALGLAGACDPVDLELLVLDLGPGDLAPLAGLHHTGAYVGAGDREGQVRLLRHVRAELERRRSVRARPGARTVLLLDGLGALREELDDAEGLDLLDDLYRVYADGPALGLWVAVAADRVGAVPTALSAVSAQRWLFRLPDPDDYSSSGVDPRRAPPTVPGRAVVAGTAQHIQVGTPAVPLAEAVAAVALRCGASSCRAARR